MMGDLSQSILLVEDDPDIREVICDLLADEDFGVVCAKNGREALNYLRNAVVRPRIILLDLYLPEMNGWQFRREQSADPMIADIPVAVVTAASEVRDIDAVAVLRKPLDMRLLLDVLRRYC